MISYERPITIDKSSINGDVKWDLPINTVTIIYQIQGDLESMKLTREYNYEHLVQDNITS